MTMTQDHEHLFHSIIHSIFTSMFFIFKIQSNPGRQTTKSENVETLRKRLARQGRLAATYLGKIVAHCIRLKAILKAPDVLKASDVQRVTRLGWSLLELKAPPSVMLTLLLYDHLLRDPVVTDMIFKECLKVKPSPSQWLARAHEIIAKALATRPISGSPSPFWSLYSGKAALNAAHANNSVTIHTIMQKLATGCQSKPMDIEVARRHLETLEHVDHYLSAHFLGIVERLPGFSFKGNMELVFSGMSPIVSSLHIILPLGQLHKALVAEGIYDAKSKPDFRAMALCYCEIAKILYGLGICPAGSQLPSMDTATLQEHLTGLAARQYCS